MKLTENEIRNINKYLEEGKLLPDEYRFKLFDHDREVELIWDGKTNEVESAVLPFQTIEHVDEPRTEENRSAQIDMFDFDNRGRQAKGWTNKLIWGDNKYILSSLKNGPLRQEIEDNGGIKLIYIDPPFDVGADFSMDIEIGGETLTKKPSVLENIAYRDTWGKGADSFLTMIYERLELMKDLMADNGSIFVHCDWRLNSFLRCILEEIFGTENYRNEILWKRTSAHSHSKGISNIADHIFYFTKSSDNYTFNKIYQEYSDDYIKSHYSKVTPEGRRYRTDNLIAPSKGYRYEWRGVTKNWRCPKSSMEKLEAEGRIKYTAKGTAEYIRYLDEMPGVPLSNFWDDVFPVNSQAIEDTLYPTQKPEKLIERIIEMASNEGDMVADFFMGSGTIPAVAEKLNRKWVGSELGKFGIHTTRKRMIDTQRRLKKEGKNYRAFEVLNLGRYQRQYYLSTNENLKDTEQTKQQRAKEEEFANLILNAYKAEEVQGFEVFAGQKAGRLVAIGPVDMQVSRDFVDKAVSEAREKSITKVDILAFEFEMSLAPHVQEEAKEKGVDLALKIIPPEVFDKRAVEKDQVKFYDIAYIEVKPHYQKNSVAIELIDFSVFYNQDIDETKMRSGQTEIVVRNGQVTKLHKNKQSDIIETEILTEHWTDWIDYWSVDFDFESREEIIRIPKSNESNEYEEKWTGNYVFENEWQSFRTKKDRELELQTVFSEYSQPGRYKIAVKVVDIFGNDTMKVIEVSI